MPQVDLMNFRVEYVRSRSGRASDEVAVRRVLNKQYKGLFRKSTGMSAAFENQALQRERGWERGWGGGGVTPRKIG